MRRSPGCADRIQAEIVLTGEQTAPQLPWNTQRTCRERAFVRTILDLDAIKVSLSRTRPEEPETELAHKTYSNLLRLWAET
jgi:predicted 2-oxoglutarate/Fe(II)-dependent dioxygenase YbiX